MRQTSRFQKTAIQSASSPASVAAARQGFHHAQAEASALFRKNLVLSAIACVLPGAAWATPEGGQVIAGSSTITSPDANTTLINQTTDQSIINWQRFNIGSDEFVQFIQPSSSSISLNRVVGGDPSTILGSLSANGHVYLVNPNGIYFGDGVQVDVSGLVASVLDIDNADFMAGNFVFSRDPNSPAGTSVINDGVITARDNGYVVLMGDYAANNGIIQAHMGEVVLASGSHITMDVSGGNLVSVAVDEATVTELAGVENSGEIYADGGRVIMTAKVAGDLIGSAVNNDGLVQANSIVEHEGAIFLTASGGDITNSGTLDASAAVGSEVDGGGILIYSDRDVTLADGAVVRATGDKTQNHRAGRHKAGAGGTVRVIAENVLDHQAGAAIDVSGADGKGGFVELSGHGGLKIRGDVEVGSGGNMLIDPDALTITNSGAVPSFTTGGTSPSTSNGFVGKGFIETQLNSNVNVTLVADNNINAGAGTLGGATFTLNATGTGNLALINGRVTSTVGGTFGTCSLTGVCLPGTGFSGIAPSTTGNINLGGVTFNIAGGLSVAGGTASGVVALGGINVGGNVDIVAGSSITLTGNTIAAGGNVAIDGNIGSAGSRRNAALTINAGNHIDINSDIYLANNNLVLVANNNNNGVGNISINGQTDRSVTIDTQGLMSVSGVDFNLNGADFGTTSVGGSVLSPVKVDANDITANLTGQMNLQAGRVIGNGSVDRDVSVSVMAVNNLTVNAASLNVDGGTALANNSSADSSTGNVAAVASLAAGNNIVVMLGGDLNVVAGTATANAGPSFSPSQTAIATANADANFTAGNNITVNAGNITIQGGTATTALGTICSSCSADATAKAVFSAPGAITLAASGAASLTLASGTSSLPFSVTGSNVATVDAGAYLSAGDLAAVAGQNISLNGSLVNTGAAGGAVWFLDAGNDIVVDSDIGTAGARFNDALTLSAGRNIDINANLFLANQTLTLAADDDVNAVGDVNINGQSDQSVTVETQGALNISGHDLNIVGATSASISGTIASNQVAVRADDANAATVTDNITINLSGDMNVAAGTAFAFYGDGSLLVADASVSVSAGNDITINAGSLNITAGNASAYFSSGGATLDAKANASVSAGGNLVATLAGNLNVSGGLADVSAATFITGAVANADANAELAAGALTVNAAGSIAVTPGTTTSTAPATVTTALSAKAGVKSQGNMNLTAGTSLTLNGDVDVGGSSLQLNAGTDLVINTDLGIASGTAARVLYASVPLGANTWLNAGNDVLLNANIYVPNNSLSVTAGNNITGGTGVISAAGLFMQAAGALNLSGNTLNIGSGTVAGVSGDALVLQAMQASGIPLPASTDPNLRLIAGGLLDVGNIALQGSSAYLWLSAGQTSVSSMSAPAGANVLLQYSPSDPSSSIGFENLPGTGQTVNYNNQDHVFPFPVSTLVIGSSVFTGDITIGANGTIDLGNANILAASIEGQIDSLDNVITTGVVASLQPSVFALPNPTIETVEVEINDPEFLDEDEKRKKLISQAEDDDANVQMCSGQ